MRFETLGFRWFLGAAACAALVGNADAQCSSADSFEDNDDCANAAAVTTGTQAGLTCQGPGDVGGDDPDFFEITVPNGEIISVEVLHTWSDTGDLDSYLYDGALATCGDQTNYLDRGFTSSDDENMSWANNTGSSVNVVIEVSAWQGGSVDVICNTYDLVVDVFPDPCASPVDDSFEENDTCGAAAALATGMQTGLFVSETDFDYYSISVPAGELLTVDASYVSGVNADVDLTLYDDAACTSQVDSDLGFGGEAIVEYSNATAGAVTVYLEVDVAAGEGCNNYDLDVTSVPDPCLGADDSFEDNDDCNTPSVAPAGTTTGLLLFGAANAGGLDEDYWVIQNVADGDILTVDVLFTDADGDIDLELYSDLGCLTQVDTSSSVTDDEQVTVANASGSAQDYYLRVEAFGSTFDCNTYDLSWSTMADPCQIPGSDDTFEDNDDCLSAAALASGTTTGLFVSETDSDFYSVSVPVGEILSVSATYGAGADVDLTLYDDTACTNQVDSDFGFSGAADVEWANATGAAATFILEVAVASGEGCNDAYDLDVSTMPDPCLDPLLDDAFEDNDDCFNTTPLSDGLYPDLFVSKYDNDFYEVQVGNGDTLVVDVFHIAADGDIDCYLYDDQGLCGSESFGDYLVRGFTGSDNEQMTWTNMSGSTQTYYIYVEIWDSDDQDCNDDYDLQISGSGGDVSTPFCFGDGTADAGGGPVGCPCGNDSTLGAGEGCNSSLGFGAILTTTGTNIVANDDLSFTITQARATQPSLLVQGSSQIATPFKDGVLCTGSPTERVEVVFLDGAGSGSTTGSIVTNGNVSPGDTRYYQQWFRDPGGVSPCGTGSNFTQGLIVNWM